MHKEAPQCYSLCQYIAMAIAWNVVKLIALVKCVKVAGHLSMRVFATHAFIAGESFHEMGIDVITVCVMKRGNYDTTDHID